MVKLKRSQIRSIEEAVAFPQGFGYVLDFSDRTIADFFEDEFGINFDDAKYATNGTSKRNRLSTLIELEDAYTVLKVLRALWDRWGALVNNPVRYQFDGEEEKTRQVFADVIADIERRLDLPNAGALDLYAADKTLEELISDIERDLEANKPEAAMDHLHTYCMKKLAHLLEVRGIECEENEALHARYGRYRKELEKERDLSAFTDRALKAAISLFESFNDIRNHRSFAHDNPILDRTDARYVFDTVSAMLVYLRAIEGGRYDP